jgi:hypothetical protein
MQYALYLTWLIDYLTSGETCMILELNDELKASHITNFIPCTGKLTLLFRSTKPGYVRLYRGESNPDHHSTSSLIPEWLKQQMQLRGIDKAIGRWFSNKLDTALWYKEDCDVDGKGRISYIDVPYHIAEESRVRYIPAANYYSADPDNEFFIPREYADTKQTLEIKDRRCLANQQEEKEKATRNSANVTYNNRLILQKLSELSRSSVIQ